MIRALLVALVATAAVADIPTHCLYEQTLGEWELSVGADGQSSSVNCSAPFAAVKKIRVTLARDDVAILDGNPSGFWTMIYDEGFEIVLPSIHQKFFAFQRWSGNPTKAVSHCGSTFPGWAHEITEDDPKNWACFTAEQVKATVPSVDAAAAALPETPSDAVLYQREQALVDAVNARDDLTWTAAVYPQFEGKTLREMQRKRGSIVGQDEFERALKIRRVAPNAHKAVPSSYDWRNVNGVDYVSPVRDQKSCGSCYAFGTTAMLEARVRINSNLTETPIFSPQYVVSCSEYSQGCDGGFPYLVSKFGSDMGLLEEHCYPYEARDTPTCAPTCTHPRHWVTDYYYVGGFYGACEPSLMQQEILANGPVAVSFMVENDFMSYKSGVYDGCKSDAALRSVAVNPWLATNHVVLIVGWGEENGVPFWTVKNSWNTSWGIDGYFKIRRGTNTCAIESMAVASTPIPVQ